MKRRQYVAMCGFVGAVSVSGCIGEDPPVPAVFGNDPKDTLTEYDTAWEEHDNEAADELIHSESPMREDERWLDEQVFGPEGSPGVYAGRGCHVVNSSVCSGIENSPIRTPASNQP